MYYFLYINLTHAARFVGNTSVIGEGLARKGVHAPLCEVNVTSKALVS